jgi:hypothetical protein
MSGSLRDNPVTHVCDNHPIDPQVAAEGEALAQAKRDARAAALACHEARIRRFGDGSMAVQAEKEVLSEA